MCALEYVPGNCRMGIERHHEEAAAQVQRRECGLKTGLE
jgi:hypothetical protein